jgi:hypothetical protein
MYIPSLSLNTKLMLNFIKLPLKFWNAVPAPDYLPEKE